MIRIITDSAADLESAEYARLQVTCIPLTVMFGDDEYQETVDLSKDRFYRLLEGSGHAPKTAQASPQILLELFEDAVAHGDEAIYITLSSRLSGTYQNACMIRDEVGSDRCHVLDGRNATGGQRILVEYAAKLRDEGHTAAEIVEMVGGLRDRIVLYACMDTMEYLYRGGRISHTAYTLGSLAQIKPIIKVQGGRVEVPTKAMGMRKGMDFLCKRLDVYKPSAEFPFYVMYTDVRANGELLAERLGMDIPPERIINVGAAIGSHVGPNACGLVYVSE